MGLERIKDKEVKKRFKLLVAFSSFLFFVLFFNTFSLQVWDIKKYNQLAENNSIRVIPKRACRGLIYDRTGEKLVDNVPSYTVSIIPADLKNKEVVVEKLSKILNIEIDRIYEKLEKQKYRVFEAIKIKGNLNSQVISIIEEQKMELPGVRIDTEPKRNYINKEICSHVLGYVGEIGVDELNNGKYYVGDIVGKSGIEKRYDENLRGINGATRIKVDSVGKQIKIEGEKNSLKGTDIVLTIDIKLQKACNDLLKDKRGVIIAMNPKNGEVYTLVSKPSFDPNIFCSQLDRADWNKLINNPDQPFLNRAIAGLYSPGSTFKIIPAVAVLEERLLTEKDLFLCHGTYWWSKWEYKCWRHDGHGNMNPVDAITYSCDIFFYQTGLLLKVDKIGDYSKAFGFGEESSIDLNGEKKGLVPTREWVERTKGIHWFPGNTIQLSIGQGYLLSTPLQMLNAYNILINNGTLYKPHLVKSVGDKETIQEVIKIISIKENTLQVVKKGLWQAVNIAGGTGWAARSKFNIAGKTATIENPHGFPHASFIGYAPFNNPEISVIAFIEGGGSGGEIAAPIVKNVIELYFKLKKERYANREAKFKEF